MTATHPAYGELRRVSELAAVLLQRNPGHMTLDGTNTWLVGSADAPVVVDPGQSMHDDRPLDDGHLERLLAVAPHPSLVLVTHRHHDHCELAAALHAHTGAPVRAFDPEHCHGGDPLVDGEQISAGDVGLHVLAAPGHTSDSAAFVVERTAVLTGDTILGRGTTIIAHPDGDLGSYLASLTHLRDLGDLAALPGHGPELPSVGAVAAMYLEHRAQRLDQVRAALHTLGPGSSARDVVAVVYADVDQILWDAAELSVEAQLAYLRH